MSVLNSSVRVLSGIGAKRASQYEKMGVRTVEDLLYHFPRAYENRGDVKLLSECVSGEKSSVMLTVGTLPRKAMIRRGMTLLKFTAYDESGTAEITFFNQNYLADKFPLGATFRFYGQVESDGRRYKLSSPAYELCLEGEALPPLVPVYPLTEGLTKNRVSADIAMAMSVCAAELHDPLPEEIRRKYKLCTLQLALRAIHSPEDYESVARARRRLVFDEFLTFSLGMAQGARERRGLGAPRCVCDSLDGLLELLPYSLTADQERAVGDIRRDMAMEHPMGRMVVGDVGCGKTAVALCAAYIALKSGRQAVLMAPTEILARQHLASFSQILSKLGYRCELLVGSLGAREKKRVRDAASDGSADMLIGTHALISDGVEFADVGIIITDEQHRFGVNQRATLARKGERAHVLVMSATPIPRSLALLLYGDLELSKINTMPAGRQSVDTFVVDGGYRQRLNAFIEKQVALGSQVYVVCPSVEEKSGENEAQDGEISFFDVGLDRINERMPPLKAAVQLSEELSAALPNLNIAFLHGKMKGAEKDEIMSRFARGEIDVLVSTTVIEVGVNVPNATLMIVENAERFGLAQLHQLRGRVGRGTQKSYCVLVSDAKGESARERLETMKRERDGFKIAEKDLLLRGPGDFIKGSQDAGVRQSGGLKFRLADMNGDAGVLGDAHEAASDMLDASPDLSAFPEIREMIEKMFSVDADSLN